MKKTYLILMALCVAFVSCTKENLRSEDVVETPSVDKEEVYQGSIPMEFRAATDETKTVIGELEGGKRKISWVKDDQIDILFNDKTTTAKAAASGATTTFSANVDEAPAYYAVYPSTVGTENKSTLSEGAVTVKIPSTQDVSAGFNAAHYAVAVAKDGNLAFKNICGWLKFTISDPSIKRVLVRGNGEQNITGKVTVTFDADGNIAETVVSEGNNRLIVDVNGVGDYYVAVLPGLNLENGVGFRFYTDHSTSGDKAIETGVFNAKALTVARGAITNLGGIDSRIVKDWYISPDGTGDGLSAGNPANGVEFLRNKLAQDETNSATKRGVAKGYGCIDITIHATGGTYDFGGNQINVTWPGHTSLIGTTIEGAADGSTVFTNTGASRFFRVGQFAALTLKNIKLTGGKPESGNGGAILVENGTKTETDAEGQDQTVSDPSKPAGLHLSGCAFDGNTAANGGAIYMAGAELTAENTTFSNNAAIETGGAAGAVGIASGAKTVTVTNCNFVSNTASRHGGGFQNYGGANTVITITGGTFSGNKTTETSGGGAAITLRGAGTIMTLDGVTISGNISGNEGAAIRVADANTLRINNCVINGNTAVKNAGGINVTGGADIFMNACAVFDNSNTTATAGNRWGPAILVNHKSANLCLNNCTLGDHTVAAASSDTNVDVQKGNLVFANSTMIASSGAGMLRVHSTAKNGTFINSVIVNKNGKSINFNSVDNGGVLVSQYVISGVAQNSYKPTADIDKAGVTYKDLGSPAFADNVYKWNGTLTDCPAAPTVAVAAGLIETANADFHAWLTELGALDKDQLGNSRSNNRQGAYCGN